MTVSENRKYIKDFVFNNAEDFLKAISYGGDLYFMQQKRFVFRGQESDKYKLIPTALRDYMFLNEINPKYHDERAFAASGTEIFQIFAESQKIKTFFDICDSRGLSMPESKRLRDTRLIPVDLYTMAKQEEWLPEEYEEIAALAQHHGLPTRLLDWTSDLNTALYFASSGAIKRQVEPKRMTRDEWLEDFKSTLHNVVRTTQSKGMKEPYVEKMEIWAFDINSILVHLCKMNLHIIHPRYCDNQNLCAQNGLFTYWSVIKSAIGKKQDASTHTLVDQESFDSKLVKALEQNRIEEGPYLYRLTVPYEAAADVYMYAKQNGKDASTLFPGYDGVVRCMIEDKRLSFLK